MPGTNLTREEARTRAASLEVDSYRVELDLTYSDREFLSKTTLRFRSRAGSTFADLVGASVPDIVLNGAQLDPVEVYRDSRIELTGLAEDNELVVTAALPYSRTGEGLHRFVDPADDRVYLYTQFEVPDARRVFTTFEQPDLKSTFEFHVTAPDDWQIVSNGSTPTPEPVRDGVAVWRFAPTQRMSTYITALIAGEYDVWHDTYSGGYDEIPLRLFCRKSLAEYFDTDDVFTITKQGFGFFEQQFQMGYPFEGTYDQAFVPEYNMGAMENAGAVTYRDEYIYRSRQTVSAYESRSNTILHEMAHMWFGDLVTMRWWDDLWLNESFAEWASHDANVKATRFTEAWTGFCNARKTWAYRQDQLPSTHPIAADNYDLEAVEVNFDGITYAKGASALRQLVAWVGEKEFVTGLRAYFQRHAYGNSELSDLMSALEESSGRELDSWVAEWLQTSGVNTLRARFETDDEQNFSSFVVEQTAHPDFPTLRRHRIAVGLYDRTERGLERRDSVEIDVTGASTDVDALVGVRRPDLILLNDGDLSYAKIRLDERSLATVIGGISDFTESLPRALCWGAAWDMTRDAEMAATDFVSLVLGGIATETDLTAVGALLNQAKSAVTLYSAPEHRDALATRWEQGLRELLDSAAPGSDHQLAFVRAYASAARSTEAAAYLVGLLDGSTVPDGLTVDADLRWSVVAGLARLGRFGEADIDAELARDNTISGQQHAGGARAQRPDAAAKAAAWEAAVVRDDVPNETQRSIAASFQVAGQESVLEPYVERYLEMADTVWEAKGTQLATIALIYLFPRAIPSAERLARIDEWLASTSANPAAKRLVSEGRDDMARALRAQERDARG